MAVNIDLDSDLGHQIERSNQLLSLNASNK